MPRNPHSRWAVVPAAIATIVTFAVVLGGAASSAQAGPPEDAVLDWNTYTLDALLNAPTAAVPGAGQTPPVSILHIAMVHGAVYDAVNMIDGSHDRTSKAFRRRPRRPRRRPPSRRPRTMCWSASMSCRRCRAIIARLTALRGLARRAPPDGRPRPAGIAAGGGGRQAMLAERANDGRYGTFTFTVGDDAGEWRPTPPGANDLNDPFAWVARVKPFTLESTSQFRTKGPHALTSGAYTKEYNEVKELGGPERRRPRAGAEQPVARFFTVNPLEMYNRAFRGVAEAEGLTIVEQARLFAMLNMAGADPSSTAGTTRRTGAFGAITAIQQGNDDGNRRRPAIRRGRRSARTPRIRTTRPGTTATRPRSCTRRRPSSARTDGVQPRQDRAGRRGRT